MNWRRSAGDVEIPGLFEAGLCEVHRTWEGAFGYLQIIAALEDGEIGGRNKRSCVSPAHQRRRNHLTTAAHGLTKATVVWGPAG